MALLLISTVSALTTHIYHDNGNFVVTYNNERSRKIKDVQAYIYVPDLDYYERTPEFYIRSSNSGKIWIQTDLEEGYHPVIVALQNVNGVREKKHTWFIN